MSSLAITPQYTPNTLTVTVTGGTSTQLTSRGSDLYNNATVYVHDGKDFNPGGVEFNASSVSSHTVYVGAGAVFRSGLRAVTDNTNTITKTGDGVWTAAFTTAATNRVASLVINGGRVTATGNTGTTFSVVGSITLNNNAVFSVQGTRSYANSIAVGNSGGTIAIGSGLTSTFSGAFNGAGTLNKIEDGTLSITNSSLAMPLNISAGAVTMAAGLGVTSGVSGTGTLNLTTTGTLTGNVTGTPTITGNYIRTAVGPVSDSGNSTGQPTIPDSGGIGTLTISGTWSGTLTAILSSGPNRKTVIVTGALNGVPTGTVVANHIALGTEATLRQSGVGSAILGPVSLGFGATFGIAAGAVATTNLITFNDPSYLDHYLTADANASNSYSGNIASGSTNGTMYVDVASGGTLSLTGANQTWSTGAPARKFIKRQAGTLKVTGKLTVNTAPFEVSAGKLEINSTSQAAFNAGLSMGASTTLACASSGAYAAQIAGAVTLAAGATMKFGSA